MQIELCGDTGDAATTSKNLLRSQSGLTQSFQRRAGDSLFVGIKPGTGNTGDAATSPDTAHAQNHQDVSTLLSHTSIPQECVCDINVLYLRSVDTLFVGNKRINQSM